MYKNLTTASILGATAVILGAFGAHALKKTLSPEALDSFETAVTYQMYHALFLLFVNGNSIFNAQQKKIISILVIVGILFFSGSIYLIQLAGVPAKQIWFITPLGGSLLIVGWLFTAYYLSKKVINKDS